MFNVRELIKAGYRLLTPFIGLVSWKRKAPVSALVHSLSVAAIAGKVASILTTSEDEVDVATYAGLLHDLYQKGISIGLYREDLKEVSKLVLEEEIGLEKKLVSDIHEFANYNVAENPRIMSSKHPEASLATWIADVVASSDSALVVPYNVLSYARYRLADNQVKLLDMLSIDVISITIPQVALRSVMYRSLIKSLDSKNTVPIIARDGLVVIRKANTPLSAKIDMYEFGLDEYELKDICIKAASRTRGKTPEEVCEEKFKLKRLTRDFIKTNGVILDKSIAESSFINVTLDNVKKSESTSTTTRCFFCGQPVHDPYYPGIVGYTIYNSASTERWNPRFAALVNVNRLMQSWLSKGIVACPLCTLDGIVYRRQVTYDRVRSVDYFVQFYYPLPIYYEVAEILAQISRKTMIEDLDIDFLDEYVSNPRSLVDLIDKLTSEVPEEQILIDSTWATHILILESEFKGENKDFAYYLSKIAKSMFLSGLYPVKFTAKVDPYFESRVLSPIYPLYDYDPTDPRHEKETPLVITTLALLYNIDDEVKKRLREEDRVNAVLKYIRYAFDTYGEILIRHCIGRQALEAYKLLRKTPIDFYKKTSKTRGK